MTPARRAAVRFVAVVVSTGIGAGVAGALLTLLLHLVQHLAYGYSERTFAEGAQAASGARRVLAMTIGGLVVGLGWWALRRWSSNRTSVTAGVADPADRPRVRVSSADAVLQIAAVGAGAALGREGAPRQVAGAVVGWLADRAGLDAARTRTLIACGAGAGLAAVYNVPLGGALFTLEVLLGSIAVADVVPAVATAVIATAVAWPVIGNRPTYLVPEFDAPGTLLVGAVLLGPIAGGVGWAFLRLTSAARAVAPTGWRLPVATTVVFAAVGAVSVAQPLVLGNGTELAELAFVGTLGITALLALLVLKPLATAACLGAGAAGGLLTPAVAVGAVLGALVGSAWTALWPGSPAGAFAVVGAAAVLAATQRAPLTATVLVVEFTYSGAELVVPVLVAVGCAVAVVRLLPAPSTVVRRA